MISELLILLHGHPVSDSHSTDYDDDYYDVCSCLQSMSVKDLQQLGGLLGLKTSRHEGISWLAIE